MPAGLQQRPADHETKVDAPIDDISSRRRGRRRRVIAAVVFAGVAAVAAFLVLNGHDHLNARAGASRPGLAFQRRQASSGTQVDALIEEARAHQRRRRRAIAATVIPGAGAVGALIASAGSSGPEAPPPTPSLPGPVSAFLAQARRGAAGAFSETYRVTVRCSCHPRGARGHTGRTLTISVRQRSRDAFTYRETPPLLLPEPGRPRNHSSEVFLGGAYPGGPRGIYTCDQALSGSGWSCVGPITGLGMGGNEELMGPYPPQALLLGLQNAVEAYRGGVVIVPPRHRQPIAIVGEQLRGRSVRCLQFGTANHPVGHVCLDSHGAIASYSIPENVTSGTWRTATLLRYSSRFGANALTLPAKPTKPPAVAEHRAGRPTTVRPCRTRQLSIRTGHSFAGLGTAGAYIRFTNQSHSTCQMSGWPRVVAVTTTSRRTAFRHQSPINAYGLTSSASHLLTGPPVVTLPPGQHADAVFQGSDHSASGAPCGPPLRWLRVRAPAGGQGTRVSAFIAWLGRDMPTCYAIRLSPVLPWGDLYRG